MITVTLTSSEIAARSQALAQTSNKLIELQDEEDRLKADYKSKMAGIKERRLEISADLKRLTRAVTLGVEERSEQQVLFDEERRMEERKIERKAEKQIVKGEVLIEQQQAAEAAPSDTDRERLHRDAVTRWRMDRPATVEREEADAPVEMNGKAGIEVHKALAREFFDEDEELRTALTLVMDAVPGDVIERWTPEQKMQAWEWAIAAHTQASDNDGFVPPMPEFLKAEAAVPGESPFQEASQADVNMMAEYYAAAQIGEEKPVRICHIDGKPHVITGAMGSGDAENWQSVCAWPILPLGEVGEENARTIKEATAEYDKQFDGEDHDYQPLSYKGVKVNCGSKKRPDWYVMVGPETTFTVKRKTPKADNTASSEDDLREEAIQKLVARVKEQPGVSGSILLRQGFGKKTLIEAERRQLIDNIDGRRWYIWTTSDVAAAISSSGPLTRSELHGLGCQLHIITQAEMEGLIQISGGRFLLKPKDDFTAPICDECRRIDGAHTRECSKSDALTSEDYLAYAMAHYSRSHQSHARKLELRRDPADDAKVREWKLQQQAGNGSKPESKAKKRAKLSPIKAAIDR